MVVDVEVGWFVDVGGEVEEIVLECFFDVWCDLVDCLVVLEGVYCLFEFVFEDEEF